MLCPPLGPEPESLSLCYDLQLAQLVRSLWLDSLQVVEISSMGTLATYTANTGKQPCLPTAMPNERFQPGSMNLGIYNMNKLVMACRIRFFPSKLNHFKKGSIESN